MITRKILIQFKLNFYFYLNSIVFLFPSICTFLHYWKIMHEQLKNIGH